MPNKKPPQMSTRDFVRTIRPETTDEELDRVDSIAAGLAAQYPARPPIPHIPNPELEEDRRIITIDDPVCDLKPTPELQEKTIRWFERVRKALGV